VVVSMVMVPFVVKKPVMTKSCDVEDDTQNEGYESC
jgi:hypothetical protein